jgi:carbamoyl-phosphate synthase small subunit
MSKEKRVGQLLLEDGSVFEGYLFGFPKSISGEVVFNTGMVGYPESLTDPSYRGQILALTYPLIGNYGVPGPDGAQPVTKVFESDKVQIAGLIVSDLSSEYNHWNAAQSLDQWLYQHKVPGLSGIDTKALTKRLRNNGTMIGKIIAEADDVEFHDPNKDNLVALVSVEEPIVYEGGEKRVAVIDCGCKNSIIRSLLARGATVLRVPWDYDFLKEDFHGVLVSNGPGDPKMCLPTIAHVRKAMEKNYPILGICLGHQILSLAAGCNTYKLKFGHRSQNQPCIEERNSRCYITSQNHGYAVDTRTMPDDWEIWFTNSNDGTNEGIRHRSHPFMSVQFHPEAMPGPVDTNILFNKFFEML